MGKDRLPVAAGRRLRMMGGDQIEVQGRRRSGAGTVAVAKHEITLHGRRIAYRTGGWGPLLVLIHGITSNSATWDQAGTMLPQLLGGLGLEGTTDLAEIGRAYALLADRASRQAFVHTLRSVVDHEGQRPGGVDGVEIARRFPSLIVWGDRDRIVPVRHGEQVHELVPHTYLSVFRRAGHFPHRDDAERSCTWSTSS